MSDYIQTWAIAARINRKHKWRGLIIKFLCWLLTGHELSKTEWGYGGGDKVDRWCRWCNKHFIVDANAFWFENDTFKEFSGLIDSTEYEEDNEQISNSN